MWVFYLVMHTMHTVSHLLFPQSQPVSGSVLFWPGGQYSSGLTYYYSSWYHITISTIIILFTSISALLPYLVV